jgi:hypothetical protein
MAKIDIANIFVARPESRANYHQTKLGLALAGSTICYPSFSPNPSTIE